MPSPLNVAGRPAELPAARGTPPVPAGAGTETATATSGTYYEDVDPRFADAAPRSAVPPPLQISKSIEEMRHTAGAASPGAESDRSNFTSISQRGVNPRWHPPPPMPGYGGQAPRRPVRPRDDVLLANPDFQLPGNRMGSPSNRGPGGGPYQTGL